MNGSNVTRGLLAATLLLASCFLLSGDSGGTVMAVSLAGGLTVADAYHRKSVALPAAPGDVFTAPIDLEQTDHGGLHTDIEFVIESPALTTAQLGDGETVVYSIEESDDEAFTAPLPRYTNYATITGADAAGAEATDVRFRLPSDCLRYVRLKATTNGSDASAASASLALRF